MKIRTSFSRGADKLERNFKQTYNTSQFYKKMLRDIFLKTTQSSTSTSQVTVNCLSVESYQMVSQIKVPSPIRNEDSSDSENISTVMTPKSTKENQLIHFNKIAADEKTPIFSHLKRASAIKMQNGGNTLPELNYQDFYSPQLSDSEYDKTGGYESGAAEDPRDKKHLCKECTRLFKENRKTKRSTEKITKKPAPDHWRCKFWMMVNRIPSQMESKRVKQHQIRSLEHAMKKLRSNKRRANPQVRCSRIHSFLKRNFHKCAKKKKLFYNLKTPQNRETPGTKRKKRKDCRPTTQRKKQNYVFVLDSSDEEDVMLNVKRYKAMGEGVEKERLQRYGDISMASDISVEELNSPDSPSILQSSAKQDKEHATRGPTFHSNPQHRNGSSHEELSNPITPAQNGSFRELLERMNSGYLRSGIVNESRIKTGLMSQSATNNTYICP